MTRNRFLHFLIGTLLCFPVSFLFAGSSVHGKVTDQVTGQPLAGAHVRITSSTGGTFTDVSGNYTLLHCPPGKTKIKASFVGYSGSEKNITLTDGRDQVLNFELVQQMLQSPEVEILDHHVQKNSQEAPIRMNLIDIRSIQETPGQNITNVLDLVSGVNLNTTQGIFANNSVVTLRGLSGNDQARTLVLVDDIPVNKTDEGSVNWNLINRDNVERIDVIKGPGPAQYGTNAMGGIINIVTRRPSKTLSGFASLEYGTFNTFGFRYTLAGKIKPSVKDKGIYYNLNGFYRRSDGYNPEIQEYLEKADTFTVNTFLREASIGTKLGYAFNPFSAVELDVNFFNDKRGRGMQIYEISGAYEKHDTYQVTGRYHGKKNGWKWNMNIYTLQEYFQRLNEYMREAEYNLYLVKSHRSDFGMMANVSLQQGAHHQLMAGIDYRQGGVDGQDIYYTSTDLISNAGKMDLIGIFIQDEIDLLKKKLQLNVGIRGNYASFHNGSFLVEYPSYSINYLVNYQDTLIPRHSWTDFDPKLSLQYRFTTETRIYLSFAKGFRAPNLDDLCRTGKISTGFKISNPSLKPENIWNLETGGDILLLKNIRISPSFYYSIGNNFMYYISTGDSVNMGYKLSPVYQKRNISKVKIYGAEVDLDYSINKALSFFANYSFSKSQISRFEIKDSIADNDLTGKYLTDVPMHKATAGITWKNRLVSLNCLWKYTGSRWINDLNERDFYLGEAKYPDYSTMDLRAWHTFFNHFTLALNITNIFDISFIDDHLQKSPGRMIMVELTGKF